MTGGPASAPPWGNPGQWDGAGQGGSAAQASAAQAHAAPNGGAPWGSGAAWGHATDHGWTGGPHSQPQPGEPQPGKRQPGQHPKLPRFLARWIRGPGSPLPLRREREGRLAGGVVAGIAAKTGIDVTALRVCVVVGALLTTGFVAAFYVVTWLLLPMSGEDTNIASRALTDKRGIGLAAGLGSVLGVLLITASSLGAGWLNAPAWPIIISVCGLVLIARNGAEDERLQLRHLVEPLLGTADTRTRKRSLLRWLLTAALIIAGLAILFSGKERLDLLIPLGGVLLMLAGIAIALAPWWLRIARDLVEERQARIRAEERADMASRVHDSVLQTLALIQRRAAEPQEVIKLARGQERELRAWLFDDQEPGTIKGEGVTLAGGIRQIQQDVEAQHRISVDAVTVGDCELDDDLQALLGAAREATVNAAKWSGADTVSLFAEVENGAVSIFVRDRGRGFDPDAVPDDRKGLAESVHARILRRGGTTAVRSAPGEGTEVALTMNRATGDRAARRA
jgi:signal transduction histidine kinase